MRRKEGGQDAFDAERPERGAYGASKSDKDTLAELDLLVVDCEGAGNDLLAIFPEETSGVRTTNGLVVSGY